VTTVLLDAAAALGEQPFVGIKAVQFLAERDRTRVP